MTLEELQQLLMTYPDTTQESPFDPEGFAYKVRGKMFAYLAWQATPLRISLKCDPVDAEALRQQFAAVTPGYHMNKRHWNTIELDGTVPDDLLERMINDSFLLVVKGLRKADREEVLGLLDQ